MTCDRERLSHYLDGELSPEEVARLHEHLESCERCSADLATYRLADDAIRRLEIKRAPGELRRRIYREIDGPCRRRSHHGWAPSLLGPAIPLTAACMVIGGAMVAWRLLPVGAAPLLTAAFAVQEAPESLEGLRVELVFDRPVSTESVTRGITIDPPLPVTEQVHENKVEILPQVTVPLGGRYRLVVANVSDPRGNVQPNPVVLNLTAGPTALVTQESSPLELRGAAPVGAAQSARLAEPAPGSDLAAPGNRAVAAPPLPTSSSNLSPLGGHAGLALLDGNEELQQRLGTAIGPERSVQVGEQAFQGGAMLTRADTSQVFVLVRSSGRWLTFPNTWRPGEVLAPTGARPPGTLEPLRGFGKVWRDQPAVKLQLGWPVYEERNAGGSIQAMENGTLVRSSYGVVYALLNDGAWRTLPSPNV
jgi:hypothetical protein